MFFVIADFCICRGTSHGLRCPARGQTQRRTLWAQLRGQLWILLWLGLLISINEALALGHTVRSLAQCFGRRWWSKSVSPNLVLAVADLDLGGTRGGARRTAFGSSGRLELRGEHGRLQGSCIMTCGMPSSHSAPWRKSVSMSNLHAPVTPVVPRQ